MSSYPRNQPILSYHHNQLFSSATCQTNQTHPDTKPEHYISCISRTPSQHSQALLSWIVTHMFRRIKNALVWCFVTARGIVLFIDLTLRSCCWIYPLPRRIGVVWGWLMMCVITTFSLIQRLIASLGVCWLVVLLIIVVVSFVVVVVLFLKYCDKPPFTSPASPIYSTNYPYLLFYHVSIPPSSFPFYSSPTSSLRVEIPMCIFDKSPHQCFIK